MNEKRSRPDPSLINILSLSLNCTKKRKKTISIFFQNTIHNCGIAKLNPS